jgi:hypothetical protein
MSTSRKFRRPRIFQATQWRALFEGTPPFLKSLKHWRDGDNAAALASFEEFLGRDPNPAAEYMAFYGSLLVLNHRSEDAAVVYNDVLRGKYRPLRWPRRSQYAQAYSHYFLSLIHRRQDAVALWLEAKRLQPTKGFGSRYLPLANSPMPAP